MKKNKMTKRICSLILAGAMLVALCVTPASAKGFSDVSSSHSYLDAINYVSDNNIMQGTGGSSFSPNVTLDRGMLMTILYRKAGSPPASTSGLPFTDVPASAYYAKAVAWAYSKGIANGTSATTFSPATKVTREQTAAFLYRYSEKTTTAVNKSTSITGYPDYNNVSSFFRTAMEWAIGNGVLKTVSGYLYPKQIMTRQETAYAITAFGTNVERIVRAKDHFSFRNDGDGSNSNFSYPYFQLTDNHYNKTLKHLKDKYYGKSKDVYDTAVKALDNMTGRRITGGIGTNAAGHCYGMCAVAMLDKYGKIAFNENFATGKTTMYQVSASPNSTMESAINYYHIAQFYADLGGVPTLSTSMEKDFNAAIGVMNRAKGPTMVGVWYLNSKNESIIHEVIVNSCVRDTSVGGYRWQVYDPDTAGISQWTVKDGSGSYEIVGKGKLYYIFARAAGSGTAELSELDYLDIDGFQNLRSTGISANSLEDDTFLSTNVYGEDGDIINNPITSSRDPETYSTIIFSPDEGLTVTNEEGQTLRYEMGRLGGDMEVYDSRVFVNGYDSKIILEVPLSKSFTVNMVSGESSRGFDIFDKYRFQYVSGYEGAATLHSDGTMELENAPDDFEVGYYCQEETKTQILSGKKGEHITIDYSNGLLSASGDLSEYTVTKTDKSGVARSETCMVSPEDVIKEADCSKEAIPSESTTFSNGSTEQ